MPAVEGIEAVKIELEIAGAQRPAAKAHGLVDTVAVHVFEPLRHHPAAAAHVGLLAGALVFVKSAPGLALHQVDRAAVAFKHDIVAIVAFLELGREIAELG